MTKTLWEIYVVEALHHRPDLADSSSFKLKKEGEELIPEYIKPLLLPLNPLNHEAVATGYLGGEAYRPGAHWQDGQGEAAYFGGHRHILTHK